MAKARKLYSEAAEALVPDTDPTDPTESVETVPEPDDALAQLENDGGGDEEMSDERLSGILKAGIEDAESYIDEYIAPDRAKATKYYKGDPLGNEETGRSQIVMTEVRDTVQTVLPELLKIFFESDHAVEFIPTHAGNVKDAEQQTDYINHIVMQDNGGVKLFFDVFKDALIRKTGIIKWYIDDVEEVTEEEYSKLSADQYMSLQEDDEIEEINYFEQINQETQELEIDTRVRRITSERQYKLAAIPPEEFLTTRTTRDIETSDLVSHRRYMTMSDMIGMGYSEDEIKEHGGSSSSNFIFNEEAQARNPALQARMRQEREASHDPSMKVYEYYETYMRIDYDGDGIAELRKICSIGQGQHILFHEVVPEIPFAIFCPDPEPHTLIGQSLADQTMDLQRIKTAVVRNTLDSLAQTVNPRTAVIEGAANMDDVMNTETGAIIRTRMVGAVTPLVEPFVGQYALPIIQYLDEVRASRTGITKASQGLDPAILQSTTAQAVSSTMSAAQARIGLIAHIFAETGFRRLFQGLLKLVIRSQEKARMLKLRGEWTEVDPKSWDASFRMTVNVGLGTGQKAEKLGALASIAGKQEEILMKLGPVNPLVTFKQYRHTLAKMIELSGHKDVSNFVGDITDETLKGIERSAQKDQKPSVEETMAQIEQMKTQAGLQEAAAKIKLEAAKLKMTDDRQRDKITAETLVALTKIEVENGTPVNALGILNELEKQRGAFNNAGPPDV